MSSSKALLNTELVRIFTDVSETSTAEKKAQEMATAIDSYIEDVIAKLSAAGTASAPSATCAIPVGGIKVG